MVLKGRKKRGSQWAAITSISAKISCAKEALRRRAIQTVRDARKHPRLATAEREGLKNLQRENLEKKRANEILPKTSAYFAQAELERRAE